MTMNSFSNSSKLSFAISPKSNVLDGITLREKINRSTLVKLINSSLLKLTFNNKMSRIYANEKMQLTAYLAKLENGYVSVTYNRNSNNPYGRSNPDRALGLYPIRRQIRHTLSSNEMTDLDIKNCHPVMLLQICNIEGIECPQLSDYVSNRQSYFYDGMKAYGCSQEDIKRLFIIYLYGGGFENWSEKDVDVSKCESRVVHDGFILELDSFRSLRESIPAIHRVIANANPHLCEIVSKIKLEKDIHQYNLKATVCSFMLQEYEIRVLEQLFLYCSNNELIENDICVLCADGLMIQTKFYTPDILQKFENLIRDTIGFDLTFTQKGMDLGYESILDKNLLFDLYTPTYSTGLISEHFTVMNSNKFLCNDGVVYTYNGITWDMIDNKNSTLHLFIDDKFYKYLLGYCANHLLIQNNVFTESKSEEETKSIDDKIKKINELLKNIQLLRKNKARKELVDDIINQITNNNISFDNDPHLFAFKNKIYDLKTNTFIKPEYSQYIKTTCGYDHSSYYSQDKIHALSTLIDTIFTNPEVKDYYLTILATGLYGQQIENFFIATGTGGNGKSLINALMMECVGSYGYKMGANVLLDEIKEGANPAIASLHCKRFVLAQEPNGKRRICTATLKEITVDKVINARMNYSNNCITKLNLTLLMECNELPALDDVGGGVERRIRAVPFTSKAVASDTYHALIDKTGYILANPFYKTQEFQQQHRQALFDILRPYWCKFQANGYSLSELPVECKVITRDYLATSDDIYGWFSEIYEKNDGNGSIVYIDDLYTRFTSSRVYSFMSKADQRKHTKKEFLTKITKNVFLQHYFKDRKERYNNVQLSKPAIVGYKLIEVIEDVTPEESQYEEI